jgi:hypothetical protein
MGCLQPGRSRPGTAAGAMSCSVPELAEEPLFANGSIITQHQALRRTNAFSTSQTLELTIPMATFRIRSFGGLSATAGLGEQPCRRQGIAWLSLSASSSDESSLKPWSEYRSCVDGELRPGARRRASGVQNEECEPEGIATVGECASMADPARVGEGVGSSVTFGVDGERLLVASQSSSVANDSCTMSKPTFQIAACSPSRSDNSSMVAPPSAARKSSEGGRCQNPSPYKTTGPRARRAFSAVGKPPCACDEPTLITTSNRPSVVAAFRTSNRAGRPSARWLASAIAWGSKSMPSPRAVGCPRSLRSRISPLPQPVSNTSGSAARGRAAMAMSTAASDMGLDERQAGVRDARGARHADKTRIPNLSCSVTQAAVSLRRLLWAQSRITPGVTRKASRSSVGEDG